MKITVIIFVPDIWLPEMQRVHTAHSRIDKFHTERQPDRVIEPKNWLQIVVSTKVSNVVLWRSCMQLRITDRVITSD